MCNPHRHADAELKITATIIAAHGRQYVAERDDGTRLSCFPRGKKSDIACGDRVEIESAGEAQGVITGIAPRCSLLFRSNEYRQKLIAANVSQILIVVATEPAFSDDLITRCIVAAESQSLRILIVLNKCDLSDRMEAASTLLTPFEQLGYPVLRICAHHDADQLRPYLASQTSVLVGQSGMGKSTLTNALIPDAQARTREISTALDTGKHTTTHASLYRIDDKSSLIDSPGLQEFGLSHLSRAEIEHAFIEFRPYAGQCRFRNCRHDREPDCAIQNALEQGLISPRRFASFLRITQSPNE